MRADWEIQADLSAVDERLRNIGVEARKMRDAIERNGGTWTPGQRQADERARESAEKALSERDALRHELQERHERLEYVRTMAADPAHTEGPFGEDENPHRSTITRDPRTVSRAEAESAALRAVEQHVWQPRQQDKLDKLIRDAEQDPFGLGPRYLSAVANPDYLTAFWRMLRNPYTAGAELSRAESEAVRTVRQIDSMRAMSLTGSAGGFAVPFTLDPTIVPTSSGVTNPLREISTVRTISTDEWRGVTSAGITAGYSAEATETTDNSPTLAQPVISTEKGQAFVPFSIEIGQDWTSMQQELGQLLQEAKDTVEADKFTNGSGTNEPFGLLTGVTNTVAAAAAGGFTIANLYSLVEALPARHQPVARFVGSNAILNRTYRLTPSGSTTEPQAMPTREGPILGKPQYELSTMPTATTVGLKFLVFGNFSRFYIIDRIGATVELVNHLFGANLRPSGQRGLYFYWRSSSKVIDSGAFRALLGQA